MEEFWESTFQAEKTSWGFEPADSAVHAKNFFKNLGINKLLIPGLGYGRNATPFLNSGFDVNGIEISKTAISLARKHGFKFRIHLGSVANMPFDNSIYEGIFCYSMLHLLNKPERKKFLTSCYEQLEEGGYMYFTVISTKSEMYATGKKLSKNRFELRKGLKVYFYNEEFVKAEFGKFGLESYAKIEEPVKHIKEALPMKCIRVICKKHNGN